MTGPGRASGASGSMPSRHEQEWDRLASVDPLWAILSDPAKRSGGWDMAEFLATGEADVSRLVAVTERAGRPLAHERALDFGCGVGRLTRALATRYSNVVGVDISAGMVHQANELNAGVAGMTFVHDASPDLAGIGSERFDLVLSLFVLQHLPSRTAIARTAATLAGRVGPGGALIVQIPAPVPIRHRIQPRRRLYAALSALGIREGTLHNRLGLSPIRMTGLDQAKVRSILQSHGLSVIEVQTDVFPGTSIVSNVYFAGR